MKNIIFKFLDTAITMLATFGLITLIIGIVNTGQKTDKEKHITCLELGIDKEKCKAIFDDKSS